MRQRTNGTKGRARKPIAVVSAFLMIATAMVALAAPSGAATTTKTVPIVCGGADEASKGLLKVIGGSIKADVDIKVTLPDKLTPGETGAKASFEWTTKLSASLANTAAGLGVKQVTMSNMVMDVTVAGPTDLKTVPGRPAARNIAVVANQPISSSAGPFTADITNVGNSGFISFKSTSIAMTVSLSLAGISQSLNIICSAPATLGTVSIQVPGSPEVRNFTEVVSKPGVHKFDILGTAKNGKDAAGIERAIAPGTLQILSGNGSIDDNGTPEVFSDDTIDVPAPAPGQTNEVVYQLCAEPVVVMPATEGVDEVQIITLDRAGADGFKRTIAFELAVGDKTTAPIWSVKKPNPLNPFAPPTEFETGAVPRNWQIRANDYIFHQFAFPPASTVKAALEAAKNESGEVVGAGNVEVEGPIGEGSQRQYKVTFVNGMGKQNVPEIEVAKHYSLPPQEILEEIINLAGSLSGGEDDPNATTTTIPGGLTINQYYDQLNSQAQVALNQANFALYLDLTGQALGLVAANPTAFIDVNAAIAAISSLFPTGPVLTTEVPGEDPTEEETQELCSQGVISVSTTQSATEDPSGDPAAPAGGDPAAEGTEGGAAATTGAPISITG